MRKWLTVGAVAAGAGLAIRAVHAAKAIDFRGLSVVIAGGSRGLGLELARVFAAEGARLTLLARNSESLERARETLSELSTDIRTLTCDVSDREGVQAAISQLLEDRGSIDVLVNVAGVLAVGPIEHILREDYEEAMSVHFWGPLNLMEAVVPHMKEHRFGRIVNISSIGGLVSIPHLVPYSASKFALTGLSDGLRAEYSRYGIAVTTVCPGLMRTGSPRNADFKGKHEEEYAWFVLADSIPLIAMSAERAARRIVEACRHGEARVILSIQARLLHGMNALLPGMTATFQKLAAHLLPGPTGAGGNRRRRGYESESDLTRSGLTTLDQKAAERNNQTAPPALARE